MKKVKQLFLFICAGMMVLSGCAEEDALSDYQSVSQAIMKGERAGDPDYSAVMSIGIRGRTGVTGYCTGTLVGKNVVLTAAHCVSNSDIFDFNAYFNDGRIAVVAGEDVNNPEDSHIFRANRLSVHTYYDQEHSYHDLALLWLDREVPQEIASPIPILVDSGVILSMLENHGRFEAVGYGVDELGESGKRLWAEGFIQKYCYLGEGYCEYTNSLDELMAIPEGALLQNLEKGGPCSGDSGGPLIVDVNGQKQVMGVVSFGDANCEIYSVSMSMPDHYPWLKKQLDWKDEGDDCSVGSLYREPQFRWWPLFLLGILGMMRARRTRTAV